jgi:hypothetical protein
MTADVQGRCLVTAICDPPGTLLEKAARLWDQLERRFSDIAVHVTTDTHPGWFELLARRDVPVATADASWDHIGRHRRRALQIGLASSRAPFLFYADPDHMLRWVERHPDDLGAVLAEIANWDCLVVGRTPEAFAAAPRRLRDTEAIVNHIYTLQTGCDWDLMMAARGFSRRAANLIANTCREDTIGNDVVWPLLCIQHGLSVGYVEADGLRYETNEVYARDGEDEQDGDPAAWMLRIKAAWQQIEAMRQLLSSAPLAN